MEKELRQSYRKEKKIEGIEARAKLLGPNRVAKGKNQRYYLIKGSDHGSKNFPLDWHLRRRKGNIFLPPPKLRRLRRKHKEFIKSSFWKFHFHGTVVGELKSLCIQKEIFLAEAEMEELLSKPVPPGNSTEDLIQQQWWRLRYKAVVDQMPSVINSLNVTTFTRSTILDTGAMMNSGDASQSKETVDTRTPLEEQLSVRGVHGDATPVTHQFDLTIPSAVGDKKIVLSKAIDIPGTNHNLVSVGLLDDAGCTTVFKDGKGQVFDKNNRLIITASKIDGLYRIKDKLLVNFSLTEFPYASHSVPRPDDQKSANYASDSEPEEDGIMVNDGDELDFNNSEDDSDSDGDYNLRDRLQQEKEIEIENEPNNNSSKSQDQIGGEVAYEVEAILDEQSMKGAGATRKTKHYLIKWKGEEATEWISCRSLKAPDLLKVWEIDKAHKRQRKRPRVIENLVMKICQLNNDVEVKPENLEEENPFKKLFDPKYSKRIEPPKGYKNMLKHVFAEHFQMALIREKMENQKWNTYKEVRRDSVPANTKILKPVTAYDIKYNARGEIEKFKSRVCLDGSRTTVDPSETYEAIANTGTIRFLMCFAARYGLDIAQTDVRNFFLQAVLTKEKKYYAEIPDGWAENDPATHIAEVLAPWYGLKESAKLAGDQLAAVYKKAGMVENPWMPKVFFKWFGDEFVCSATHIDDGLWIYSSRKHLDEVLDAIDKEFKMTRTYDVTKILGMEVEYSRILGLMKLHQGSYNREKLMEMGFQDRKQAHSPGNIPIKIINPEYNETVPQASIEDVRRYQKKVGVQMWGLQTDPSSMFVVH